MQNHASDALKLVTLKTQNAQLSLLNFGATTRDWRVSSGDEMVPMILGFEDPKEYLTSQYFFGTIAGRVSNRIGDGRYQTEGGVVELDKNEGATTLHGGSRSLSLVIWDLSQVSDTQARFEYHSPDGEMGFPGNARIEVLVTLSERQLRYDMKATVDAVTPISLAQHNYYNFGGTRDIWDYRIKCPTHSLLEQNDIGVSTGKVIDTSGGPLDLRNSPTFRQFEQSGLDCHFIFDDLGNATLREVADIRASDGKGIKIFSDQDGAQIYTAHGLPNLSGGLDGANYGAAAGLCFEPQGYPNAVNIKEFPSVMASPEKPYQQTLIIEAVGME
ncbi:aldose epimerase family protein [Cognatishimia activa]|uniref:aldose epimerase family protein n=1 Tax=Cognatishimia activa TaxID=1715691 RepID=UPI00222EEF68|nr:aldose epimerase family protein [Cognatishimia activa]UZD91376.1 galactose mutarotase [Cognatishimia activa]